MPAADNRPTQSNAHLAAVVGCILIGMALRWWNLGGESLWFDEAYTAWAAGLSVGELIEVVRVDNAPPLYYLLMRAWVRMFGDGEWSLRVPSALAGSIALLLTPLAALRLWGSRRAALAATVLAAVGFLPIRYAHEARTYELMSLAGLLAIMALLQWGENRSRWAWLGIVLCLSAMTWMHNMAWLYVASFATAMLVWPTTQPLPRRGMISAATLTVVVVLYAPWATALAQQVQKMTAGFWIPTPNLTSLYYTTVLTAGVKLLPIGYFFRDWFGSVHPGLLVLQVSLALVMLVLCGSIALTGDTPKRRRAAAVAIVALLPILGAFLVSRFTTSVFTPKAFVPTAMIMPLLLAAGVDAPRKWRVASIAAIGVLSVLSLLSVLGQFRHERKENWAAAHAYLAEHARPASLLVFVGNDGELGLRYYEKRDGPIDGMRIGLPVGFFENHPPRAMQRVSDAGDLAALHEAIARHQPAEIVLIGCHMAWADPSGLAREAVASIGTRIDRANFAGVMVERYRVGW